MKSKSILYSGLLIVLSIFQFLPAQELPPVPDQWVADYAGLLSSSQKQNLNRMLRTYEDTTSNQIIVAVFQNAQDYPVEEFTIRLAEKWKIGQKDRDNGIILAVFLDERKVRIEVAYGLEDVVPDVIASRIINNLITPQFKEGNYYQGLVQGSNAIMLAAGGKFDAIPNKAKKKDKNPFSGLAILIFIFIAMFLMRRRRRVTVGSRGWHSGGPFFFGGFGGSGSSGGGFFGGGGGGFSAGGGSFGGGGATGSW